MGGTVAAKLSRLIGHGDYDVGPMPVHNSLLKKAVANMSFGNDLTTQYRIRRREFVKTITADATDFSVDTLTCQPGLTEPFPYLSNIARCFSKYSMEGLVYEYISNVSGYSSVPSMGSIIMTFDPNQSSDPPSNKIAMENMAGAVSCRPDRDMVYGVECAKHLTPFKQYFVRTGSTPYQTNVAEDFGTMIVASSGLPASVYTKGTKLGELWVTYDIIFDVPRLPTLEVGFLNYYGSGISATTLLGSVQSWNSGGILFDATVGGANRQSIQLANVPPGSVVVISATWRDSAATNTYTPSVAGRYGCKAVGMFIGSNGLSTDTVVVGAGTANASLMAAVEIVASIPTDAGYSEPTVDVALTGTLTSAVDLVNLVVYTLGQGQSFAP